VIIALNENGMEKGLEHLPVVQVFSDVFLEEIPRFPPKREIEIYHQPKTRN
jgi:hypothetical protein